MSSAQRRPFTAATDKFAYAQVFTRASIRQPGDPGPLRPERRLHLALFRRHRHVA